MQIPKRFKLGDKRYEVRVIPMMEKRATMGEFCLEDKLVTVAQQSNITGRYFKSEEMADTFWHETVHAILFDMGHRLAKNEDFVTQFSRRLNEIVHTAEL
jgi:hypothetical protein